jgi:threonyl-tRNA synthetase
VTQLLKQRGIRVINDLRNEKIGFKIRERTLERIPYLLVLGDREVEEGTVNVRTRTGKNLGTMSIDTFVDLVQSAVAQRGRYILE